MFKVKIVIAINHESTKKSGIEENFLSGKFEKNILKYAE